MDGASAERLLDGLDPEQRQVATTLDGPVRVLAGAGTGKTRAITHRLAYAIAVGAVEPTRVLAVTFTTRAAGEMRSRLAGLGAAGVQARRSTPPRFGRHATSGRRSTVASPRDRGSKIPLLAEAAGRCRLRPSASEAPRDLAGGGRVVEGLECPPDDYQSVSLAAGRAIAAFDAPTVARVFEAYEAVAS